MKSIIYVVLSFLSSFQLILALTGFRIKRCWRKKFFLCPGFYFHVFMTMFSTVLLLNLEELFWTIRHCVAGLCPMSKNHDSREHCENPYTFYNSPWFLFLHLQNPRSLQGLMTSSLEFIYIWSLCGPRY